MKYFVCYVFGNVELIRLLLREIIRWILGITRYITMVNNIKWCITGLHIFGYMINRFRDIPEGVVLRYIGGAHKSVYGHKWLEY